MNNPLATLFDQFRKERIFLKNVSPRTLTWCDVAFKNYIARLEPGTTTLPTKSSPQHFLIVQRERGLRPVTCNTYIGALNAFCRWLHDEHHIREPLTLKKLRVEQRECWRCSTTRRSAGWS